MPNIKAIRKNLAPYVDAINLETVMEDGFTLHKISKGNTAILMGTTKEVEDHPDGDLFSIDLMHTLTDEKSYDELLTDQSLEQINSKNENTVAMHIIKQKRIHDVTTLMLDGSDDLVRIMHVINTAAGISQNARSLETAEPEIAKMMAGFFEDKDITLTNKDAKSITWQYSDGENPPIDYKLNYDKEGYPKLDIRVAVPDDFFGRHIIYDNVYRQFNFNPMDFRDSAHLKRHVADQMSNPNARRRYAALHNTEVSENFNTRIYVDSSGAAEAICSISLNHPISRDVVATHTRLMAKQLHYMFYAPEIDPHLFMRSTMDSVARIAMGGLMRAILG